MAEMLIDGAKLDACNTAEADAIRAKTGGSSPIPYDYANNKGFADAIAAIPSGGGGGEVLLGSGTYTLASNSSSMTIPVSISGAPISCLVVAESVSQEGIQTAAWCAFNQQQTEAQTLFPIVYGARGATANGYTSPYLIPQSPTALSNNNITVYQINNNYPIRANTYNWYIWGYSV